jgi:hypothetical protein
VVLVKIMPAMGEDYIRREDFLEFLEAFFDRWTEIGQESVSKGFYDDSLLARSREELTRLRALEQDVRWNKVEMDSEKTERLRQYLAGKSEISAGDALVLRDLHAKARARQRYVLGLPLLAIGIWGLWAWLRRRAS